MSEKHVEPSVNPPREQIVWNGFGRKGARRFLCFLICVTILVAAFAVTGLFQGQNREPSLPNLPDTTENEAPENKDPPEESLPNETYPEGSIPIESVRMDHFYFENETLRSPNLEELLQDHEAVLKTAEGSDGPTVLILHTHATEAYSDSSQPYLEGSLGDLIYSSDRNVTVQRVGEVLCETLNSLGIAAIQCGELHGEAGTLLGAYRHSAECIQKHLEENPSILYVIDLHRDGILTADGALVKTSDGEERGAQVMAVVGTDGNGTEHPKWQKNLALALQLMEAQGDEKGTLWRGVVLRNASYNQELAPRMLLLEIGSAGNSVEEACAAAIRIGETLARLLSEAE